MTISDDTNIHTRYRDALDRAARAEADLDACRAMHFDWVAAGAVRVTRRGGFRGWLGRLLARWANRLLGRAR